MPVAIPVVRRRLSDGVITVRAMVRSDVDPLFEAARESIEDIAPWMDWAHPAYTRDETAAWVEQTIAWWETGEQFPMVIEAGESGRVLGGCGINRIVPEFRMANLGYWVRTSATGRGVATAAVRLCAWLGLAELDLQRLEIIVAVGNVASQRVADKVGAVREGVARSRLWVRGRSLDAVVFSLTRTELPALRPPVE